MLWRDGAQGDGDRGGCRHIFSSIGFQGKKIKITNFVVALGGRQSAIPHDNQPNLRVIDGGGILEEARPSGNAGGAVFDRSGGDRVGRGENIK
jgi:hypothetical protein